MAGRCQNIALNGYDGKMAMAMAMMVMMISRGGNNGGSGKKRDVALGGWTVY